MKVGIDLGTTYSTVAVFDENTSKAEIIPNRYGTNLTPSVICFMDDGTMMVGDDAKSMQKNGVGTIASVFKSGIGTERIYAKADGKSYTAEDLSSIMLKELIAQAEKSTGSKIDGAVMTVPAYFNDLQRASLERAAVKAGIKVEKIVNEPTAAAVHYGYGRTRNGTLMVYDLGGGTFDITVVDITKGEFTVLGTDGDHTLGGVNWDKALLNLACDDFRFQYGMDPGRDRHTYGCLLTSAESCKRLLSSTRSARMKVEYRGKTGVCIITREAFEKATECLIESTGEVVDRLLSRIGKTVEEIDEVLLCGGSTHMPQVRKYLLSKGFGSVKLHGDVSEAVSKGAAMIAHLQDSGTGYGVNDIAPHSLGVLYIDPVTGKYTNKILIERNTRVPVAVHDRFLIEKGNMTDKIEIFTLQGESRNPSRCVAIRKDVITGFENFGTGIEIDLEYSYTDESRAVLKAKCGRTRLKVTRDELPDDMSWVGKAPGRKKMGRDTKKNIVFCIDLSRSMKDSLEKVKAAVKNSIGALGGNSTRFALIGFADRVEILCGLTYSRDQVMKSLEDLKVNMLGRGTDGHPFAEVSEVLSGASGIKIAIVLTDGVWGEEDYAEEQSKKCRESGIDVVAVGFGDSNLSFLRRIATVEEAAMYIQLENLERTINTIATADDKAVRDDTGSR